MRNESLQNKDIQGTDLHQHADCEESLLSYLPAGGVLPEVTECCGEPVVDVVEGQLLVGGLQNSLEQGAVTKLFKTPSSLSPASHHCFYLHPPPPV